jgi:voltage-dependent calcium channel L type alpha-1F
VVALGATPLESRSSYVTDGWNVLDGLIVVISWISLFANGSALSSLRVTRVLRPLRTLSRVQGMRLLVNAFLKSLPKMFDVILLFSFFLLGFAILGVELFKGRLHYRCYANADPFSEPLAVCTCATTWRASDLAEGNGGCDDNCDLEAGESCLYTPTNPNGGSTSYDDIFHAIVNIFQCISLEGWSEQMHMFRVSMPTWAIIYFISLVVFGACFVVNLYLVVMSDA